MRMPPNWLLLPMVRRVSLPQQDKNVRLDYWVMIVTQLHEGGI